jgi:hypothetical protein
VEVATLIGDLVASREHLDRSLLHRRLQETLRDVNRVMSPSQPLEATIGDEFQGCFKTVADAARASVLVRLMLLVADGGADSRYGLGSGTVTVLDAGRSPASQDGPGWWSARGAIDRAAQLGNASRTSFVRTCFTQWRDGPTPWEGYDAAVEAFLLCRDAAIGHMTDRQRRLLLGVMLGHGQGDLAAQEGITQSAVSQTLSRSGATAIEAAHRRLESVET